MYKLLNTIAITFSFMVFSLPTSAHSEHDKARFVANTGKDVGQCDNVLRPCKTIEYAVSQANKGDKVLVASGSYQIKSADELFFLTNSLVPVSGGYNRFDHYQNQSPQLNSTTIIGAPLEMASALEKSGFSVISDGKSQYQNDEFKTKLASYQSLQKSQSQTTCVNGKAGVHDCKNMDLLSHIPLAGFSNNPSAANDIWGHVDLNTGNEYAIIGLRNGTAVIDLSDPTAPKEVGTISGVSVTWRDIKVYQYFDNDLNLWQAYAYVTLDGSNTSTTDHVTIISLNNLPHSISLVENNETVYKAHNVYISNIDHSLNTALPNTTPTLQLIGTNKGSGQFRNYSINDPRTLSALPTSYTQSESSGSRPYTHDGASVLIDDTRKDRDCIDPTASNCSIFIDFNETEMLLWDISDTSKVTSLGSVSYSNPQYVHSGWSSEDKQYVFLHDELDESRLGLNTTLRIFSIEDLNDPTLVGEWVGSTRAIDHNGFVRGNRYYMSNYERGVTVLDISDPTAPEEIGFFDTFPQSNNANFNGAWGVYPFLPSGTILVSDINSGLYIIKDNTLSSSQGNITFGAKSIDVLPSQKISIPIRRINAASNASTVSVNYELLSGSAKNDVDYTPIKGELTWQDNINGIKSINVDIAALSDDGLAKSFFVRLFDPKNGATLTSPSYIELKIDGNADNSSVSFVQEKIQVSENQNSVNIVVARNGNATDAINVDYTLTTNTAVSGEDFDALTGTLLWAAGDSENKTITAHITDDQLEETLESFTISLSNPTNTKIGAIGSYTVEIADDDSNQAPTVNINENFEVNTSQTVTLTATADDTDNDEMTYLWAQTAGESVALNNADSLSANFTAPNKAGELTFEFTATDFRGASSSSSVTVTVVAPVEVITVTPSKSGGGGSVNFYLLLLLLVSACYKRNKQ